MNPTSEVLASPALSSPSVPVTTIPTVAGIQKAQTEIKLRKGAEYPNGSVEQCLLRRDVSNAGSDSILQLATCLQRTFPLPDWVTLNRCERAGYAGVAKAENTTHFLVSNDGISDKNASIVTDLKERSPGESNGLRVSCLIGESSFLSSLPELSRVSEAVLLIDYDPFVLYAFMSQLAIIRESGPDLTEEAFLEKFLDQLYPDAIKQNQPAFVERQNAAFLRDYADAKKHLGDDHLFSSAARFAEVQAACKKLNVTPVYMDMFSASSHASMTRILNQHNATISCLNLTNLLEYWSIWGDSEVLSSMKTLPIADNALCVHPADVGAKTVSEDSV
ncbi:MAG: hypothetical protein ACR2PX_23205 [Endozoicomonas sp.]|uniref:hypothetical protein n=1 Tax=Endozoicomonas sp. TaxID=1892382 RepID=UPI003D9BC0F1